MKPAGNRTDIPDPTEVRESRKEKEGLGAGCQGGKDGGGWRWGLLKGGTEEGSRGRRCHLPNPTQIHFVQTFLKVEREWMSSKAPIQDHGRCLQELETPAKPRAVGALTLTGGAQAPADAAVQSGFFMCLDS